MTTWGTEEDFSQDFQDVSVLGDNAYCDDRVLTNADQVRRRLQVTQSTFFDDEIVAQISSDEDASEDVVFCKPVRGRPLRKVPYTSKPGGKSSFLENQNETFFAIRKAYGLNFSNDTIENALRQDNKHKDNSSPKPKRFSMPNIHFNSSSASKSSSSSPICSSRQSLADNTGTRGNPCERNGITKLNNILSENGPPPPPLYDIIKNNSKKKDLNRSLTKEQSQICRRNCKSGAEPHNKVAKLNDSIDIFDDRDLPTSVIIMTD